MKPLFATYRKANPTVTQGQGNKPGAQKQIYVPCVSLFSQVSTHRQLQDHFLWDSWSENPFWKLLTLNCWSPSCPLLHSNSIFFHRWGRKEPCSIWIIPLWLRENDITGEATCYGLRYSANCHERGAFKSLLYIKKDLKRYYKIHLVGIANICRCFIHRYVRLKTESLFWWINRVYSKQCQAWIKIF